MHFFTDSIGLNPDLQQIHKLIVIDSYPIRKLECQIQLLKYGPCDLPLTWLCMTGCGTLLWCVTHFLLVACW